MSENEDLSFLDDLGLGFGIDRLGPATRPTPMPVSYTHLTLPTNREV